MHRWVRCFQTSASAQPHSYEVRQIFTCVSYRSSFELQEKVSPELTRCPHLSSCDLPLKFLEHLLFSLQHFECAITLASMNEICL
ncbi:hypothetical protein EG68_04721 [Paragonimus skrjabini miyazakii]|uniref:Uncharacterized protein n=1 Tax=Paragonimus skrjabini miyazakii TaxID=59628 RepID=A0A8S9Z3P0_9TREM|nr:hypothetical protein EG68_04721 [Paragonimus skrjabini miyazakii]